MPTVTVIGSLNTDLVTVTPRIPEAGETLEAISFDIGCGGKGANQGVGAARSSRYKLATSSRSVTHGQATVRMVGAVGCDTFGETLRNSLADDGLDVSLIKTVEGTRTGNATILVEESTGENRILYVPGANHSLTTAQDLIGSDGYGEVVLLQLETPHDVVFHHIKAAKSTGTITVLNPSPAARVPDEVLGCVDHLILNQGEAEILAGQTTTTDVSLDSLQNIAHFFTGKGVKNVILTLGAKGVFLHSNIDGVEYSKVQTARKVKVVDTTAAGDTFAGAYAARLAMTASTARNMGAQQRFDNLYETVDFAQKAASITVQRPGAQSAIPWLDDIESVV